MMWPRRKRTHLSINAEAKGFGTEADHEAHLAAERQQQRWAKDWQMASSFAQAVMGTVSCDCADADPFMRTEEQGRHEMTEENDLTPAQYEANKAWLDDLAARVKMAEDELDSARANIQADDYLEQAKANVQAVGERAMPRLKPDNSPEQNKAWLDQLNEAARASEAAQQLREAKKVEHDETCQHGDEADYEQDAAADAAYLQEQAERAEAYRNWEQAKENVPADELHLVGKLSDLNVVEPQAEPTIELRLDDLARKHDGFVQWAGEQLKSHNTGLERHEKQLSRLFNFVRSDKQRLDALQEKAKQSYECEEGLHSRIDTEIERRMPIERTVAQHTELLGDLHKAVAALEEKVNSPRVWGTVPSDASLTQGQQPISTIFDGRKSTPLENRQSYQLQTQHEEIQELRKLTQGQPNQLAEKDAQIESLSAKLKFVNAAKEDVTRALESVRRERVRAEAHADDLRDILQEVQDSAPDDGDVERLEDERDHMQRKAAKWKSRYYELKNGTWRGKLGECEDRNEQLMAELSAQNLRVDAALRVLRNAGGFLNSPMRDKLQQILSGEDDG